MASRAALSCARNRFFSSVMIIGSSRMHLRPAAHKTGPSRPLLFLFISGRYPYNTRLPKAGSGVAATHRNCDRNSGSMVTIRLSRGGAKSRPFYYIVVTDSRCKRNGKKLERVGFFNPMSAADEPRFQIDKARVD